MDIKKLALALSLTAAFTYMGCDDSSTSPATGGDEQPVLSSDSNGGEGGDGNVASSGSNDAAGGDEQTVSSSDSNEASPASSGDTAPASSADVGPGTLPGSDTTFVLDTTAIADMMKCDEEGATQQQYGMTMTCVDGQWAVDSSSIADMMKCEPEGETMEMMGTVMVCKGGSWEVDSVATAEASKCDLGPIQTAGQGQFEIEDRDQNTPYIKKLRVVTTITYSLKD